MEENKKKLEQEKQQKLKEKQEEAKRKMEEIKKRQQEEEEKRKKRSSVQLPPRTFSDVSLKYSSSKDEIEEMLQALLNEMDAEGAHFPHPIKKVSVGNYLIAGNKVLIKNSNGILLGKDFVWKIKCW